MVCLATGPTRGLAIRDIVVDITVDAMSLYWIFSAHLLDVNESVGYNLKTPRGVNRFTEPTRGLATEPTHDLARCDIVDDITVVPCLYSGFF